MTLTKEQRDEEFREWKRKMTEREPKEKAKTETSERKPIYAREPGEKS